MRKCACVCKNMYAYINLRVHTYFICDMYVHVYSEYFCENMNIT